MNEAERALLIKDIKAELLHDITQKEIRAVNTKSGPLSEVREKYNKALRDKYKTYYWAQVWDNIRRLSCYMVGVRYARDLYPSIEVKAAEIAEKLCLMALEERDNESTADDGGGVSGDNGK
jgi:hypothetical protein